MLAIIPARGGSKGIKKKNIRHLYGKPLIHWTIEAACNSKEITDIILSTDDPEIVDTCKHLPIKVPFLRDPRFATDTSVAIDNYLYTINKLNNEYGYNIEDFIVLLPTCPLRNSLDIDSSIKLFKEKKASSVISSVKMEHPIEWVYDVDQNFKINKYTNLEESKTKNRQDYRDFYIPNGGIYIFKYSKLKANYNYYFKETFAYIMPKERSVDIDNIDDFEFAEFLFSKIYKN